MSRNPAPAANAALVKMGEDISEQLDVIPAQFIVHRHIRPQYACLTCETISAAPVPAAIIDGGLAAPGLQCWVTIGKYGDHQPLYRIEQMAAREGVTLSRSTLSEWIGRIGVALTPLARTSGGNAQANRHRACRRNSGGKTGSRCGQGLTRVPLGISPQQPERRPTDRGT